MSWLPLLNHSHCSCRLIGDFPLCHLASNDRVGPGATRYHGCWGFLLQHALLMAAWNSKPLRLHT